MNRYISTLFIAAAALAAAACHSHPYREEPPHHYSVDRYGNRLACYPLNTQEAGDAADSAGDDVPAAKGAAPSAEAPAKEYECLPEYGNSYAGYYDPFWPPLSLGFYYGWSYPFNTIIITEPRTPPPRRPPPRRPLPRSDRDVGDRSSPGHNSRQPQARDRPMPTRDRFPQRRPERAGSP